MKLQETVFIRRRGDRVNEMFSLKGKTAVVTGCATGIGQGIAAGLAKAGADIIAFDIASLEETAAKVETLGRKCTCISMDLADTASIDRAWDQALEGTETVEILCNNAGMQFRASAYEYPMEAFDKIMAVNLRAAYYLSQKAACHFRERHIRGKIVNTASLFSVFGGMNVSGYTCSKHGVLGLTKAMSNEFAPDGICVNAIAPGYIQTELTKSIWTDAEKRRPMDERLPLGRWGTPEDFEGVAVFLASQASDYITGVMIPVDGGYTCR